MIVKLERHLRMRRERHAWMIERYYAHRKKYVYERFVAAPFARDLFPAAFNW